MSGSGSVEDPSSFTSAPAATTAATTATAATTTTITAAALAAQVQEGPQPPTGAGSGPQEAENTSLRLVAPAREADEAPASPPPSFAAAAAAAAAARRRRSSRGDGTIPNYDDDDDDDDDVEDERPDDDEGVPKGDEDEVRQGEAATGAAEEEEKEAEPQREAAGGRSPIPAMAPDARNKKKRRQRDEHVGDRHRRRHRKKANKGEGGDGIDRPHGEMEAHQTPDELDHDQRWERLELTLEALERDVERLVRSNDTVRRGTRAVRERLHGGSSATEENRPSRRPRQQEQEREGEGEGEGEREVITIDDDTSRSHDGNGGWNDDDNHGGDQRVAGPTHKARHRHRHHGRNGGVRHHDNEGNIAEVEEEAVAVAASSLLAFVGGGPGGGPGEQGGGCQGGRLKTGAGAWKRPPPHHLAIPSAMGPPRSLKPPPERAMAAVGAGAGARVEAAGTWPHGSHLLLEPHHASALAFGPAPGRSHTAAAAAAPLPRFTSASLPPPVPPLPVTAAPPSIAKINFVECLQWSVTELIARVVTGEASFSAPFSSSAEAAEAAAAAVAAKAAIPQAESTETATAHVKSGRDGAAFPATAAEPPGGDGAGAFAAADVTATATATGPLAPQGGGGPTGDGDGQEGPLGALPTNLSALGPSRPKPPPDQSATRAARPLPRPLSRRMHNRRKNKARTVYRMALATASEELLDRLSDLSQQYQALQRVVAEASVELAAAGSAGLPALRDQIELVSRSMHQRLYDAVYGHCSLYAWSRNRVRREARRGWDDSLVGAMFDAYQDMRSCRVPASLLDEGPTKKRKKWGKSGRRRGDPSADQGEGGAGVLRNDDDDDHGGDRGEESCSTSSSSQSIHSREGDNDSLDDANGDMDEDSSR